MPLNSISNYFKLFLKNPNRWCDKYRIIFFPQNRGFYLELFAGLERQFKKLKFSKYFLQLRFSAVRALRCCPSNEEKWAYFAPSRNPQFQFEKNAFSFVQVCPSKTKNTWRTARVRALDERRTCWFCRENWVSTIQEMAF